MASNNDVGGHDSGYDCDFVEGAPRHWRCPICLLTLREPYLTLCCGKEYCRPCYERVWGDHKPCPLCQSDRWQAFPHVGTQRSILGLQVRCKNKTLGCDWVGELRKLEQHLAGGSRAGECQFEAMPCVHQCGEAVQRRILSKHENDICANRPLEVTLRSLTSRLEALMQENQALRSEVSHLKAVQEKQADVIAELKASEDSKKRVEEVGSRALSQRVAKVEAQQLMDRKALTEQVKAIEECLPAWPLPPFHFTMGNFELHRQYNWQWFSPPFYSHVRGYKFCAWVQANGWQTGKGTYLSLFITPMRGEYDDALLWPFKANITVQLVNTLSNTFVAKNIFVHCADSVPCGGRSTIAYGVRNFIPHDELQKMKFIQDHDIHFVVTKIEQLS